MKQTIGIIKIGNFIQRKSDFLSAINSEYRDGGKLFKDLTGLTLFFEQKNGLSFEDVSVYRIPH